MTVVCIKPCQTAPACQLPPGYPNDLIYPAPPVG